MDKDDQIQRLTDILQEKSVLISGEKVQTIGLRVVMEIVGFIPCTTDTYNYFFQFDSDFAIGADKIRVKYWGENTKSDSIILPISRRLVVPNEGETYEVNKTLRLPEYDENYYLKRYKNKNIAPNTISNILALSCVFKKVDSGLVYNVQNDDFVFYRWQDQNQSPISIAKEYYCLCSYINKVTGKICYHVYSPYDLVIIPHNL